MDRLHLNAIIKKINFDEYLSAIKCGLGRHFKSQHHISNIHKWPANVMPELDI